MTTDRFKVEPPSAHAASTAPAEGPSPVLSADGRHQPVPAGDILLFHRGQLSAQVPSAAEGGEGTFVWSSSGGPGGGSETSGSKSKRFQARFRASACFRTGSLFFPLPEHQLGQTDSKLVPYKNQLGV